MRIRQVADTWLTNLRGAMMGAAGDFRFLSNTNATA